MENTFSFTLDGKKGKARAGTFYTPHGKVQTPIFMPVGTLASVKALDTADVEKTQAQIVLANTYHLYLRPGMQVLQQAEGIHDFMKWPHPVLTDSGGFQVFSLGTTKEGKSLVQISEESVEFKSHIDGSSHTISPEDSIEIQRSIGADIIMAFDEAMSDSYSEEQARASVKRTHRWAERCYSYWQNQDRLSHYGKYQALFGIVQGGLFEQLRKESAQFITGLDFDGIAVGGETIGYNMPGTVQVMEWIEARLPQEKPRYAMGLGRDPQDIIDATLAGFDMFDCVGPTRLARNGALYEGSLDIVDQKPTFVSQYAKGRMSIGNAEFASDFSVINNTCDCYTCQTGYTKAYLHHLYRSAELSYYRLASIHNIRTMERLSTQLRDWILNT